MSPLDERTLLQLAGYLLNCRITVAAELMYDFRAHFGLAPKTIVALWNLCSIHDTLPPKATPTHLLWALLHLKVYASEATLCRIAKTNQKTWRKWVQLMLPAMSKLVPVKVSVVCCHIEMTSKGSSGQSFTF